MPTDAAVEDQIRGLLSRDPRLPAPDEVAVSATDGAVVLRGTVGSFSQRRAAVGDARKVPGVYDLDDQLQVRLLKDAHRSDAEIRGIALQILHWDTEVPDDQLDVQVDEGWLTLTGTVNYQFESDAAYNDVTPLQGVLGVTNKIEVITP
jgi:osmotically-inducible protein OsmY